jgi:hypothetical protein
MGNQKENSNNNNDDDDDNNDFNNPNSPFTSFLSLWQQQQYSSPMFWSDMYNEYMKYATRMAEI